MAPQYKDVSLAPVADTKESMEREIEAYSEHIRNLFADVPELKPKYIPITRDTFFTALQDGVLLAYIINEIKANSVNLQKINTNVDASHLSPPPDAEKVTKEHTKDLFEATNNLNVCLEAAGKVAKVVNTGAEDFIKKKPDLVLGVIWQLIRAHLLSDINVPSHPELIRLLLPGESLTALIGLTNEQVLLRWVNYHLARAGSSKRVHNFGSDVTDSEAYCLLLQQVAPGNKREVVDNLEDAIKIPATDKEARAKAMLEAAEKLGCRKFVTVADIVHAHARLNLAFVATVFAKHIGIHLPTEEEARATLEKAAELEADNAVLRAKVVELEKSIGEHARNAAFLEDQLASKTSRLESALEELRTAKEKQILDLETRLAALKDEQAGAVETQQVSRKQVGTKLGMVRSMLQDHIAAVKQEGDLAAKLHKLLGGNASGSPAKEDLPPAPQPAKQEPAGMMEEIEYLSEDLQTFVKEILDENREQKKIILILAARAEQSDKINSMIGDKIRSYTESQIAMNPVKDKKKEKEHKEVKPAKEAKAK